MNVTHNAQVFLFTTPEELRVMANKLEDIRAESKLGKDTTVGFCRNKGVEVRVVLDQDAAPYLPRTQVMICETCNQIIQLSGSITYKDLIAARSALRKVAKGLGVFRDSSNWTSQALVGWVWHRSIPFYFADDILSAPDVVEEIAKAKDK